MNYLVLKNIIATVTTNFRCPNCQLWTPKDDNLEIQNISQSGIEILYICPQCQKKTIVKAETSNVSMEFLQTPFWKKLFKKMSQENAAHFSTETIKALQEKLDKSITIKDLIDGQ